MQILALNRSQDVDLALSSKGIQRPHSRSGRGRDFELRSRALWSRNSKRPIRSNVSSIRSTGPLINQSSRSCKGLFSQNTDSDVKETQISHKSLTSKSYAMFRILRGFAILNFFLRFDVTGLWSLRRELRRVYFVATARWNRVGGVWDRWRITSEECPT